jgi:hypothetical protein
MASVTDIGTLVNPLSGPVFGGPIGWGAAVRDALNSSDVSVDTRIANHAAAADPHPTYLQTAEGDARYSVLAHNHAGTYDPAGTANSVLAAHEAAADPHAAYQKESEKGAVNGYAALDAGGKVPTTQLPAVGVTDHGALTGLLDDDHTQYQLRTEKGQANGYAELDATGKVPAAQVGVVASPPEVGIQDAPPPAPIEVVLWVDPNDFQGDSGWQGFDARYINADGDTINGTLYVKHPTPTGQALGEMEPRADGGFTFIYKNSAGTRTIALVLNNGVAAWAPLTALEGFVAQNGFGGATTFEITKAGAVRVVAAPTAADHAANKAYVDGKVATATISSTAPASPVTGQLWATP